MPDGGDIIIRGGSVELEYDDSVYFKVPGNPGKRKKDKNSNKQIQRILVTDNAGAKKYDSDTDDPGKFTVSVFTK